MQQRLGPQRVPRCGGGGGRGGCRAGPPPADVQHGSGGAAPELGPRHQPRGQPGELAGAGGPLRQRVPVEQRRRRPHLHEPRELHAEHEQPRRQHPGPADQPRRVGAREPHLVAAGPHRLQLHGASDQSEHRKQHGCRHGHDLQAHQVVRVPQAGESLPGGYRRAG